MPPFRLFIWLSLLLIGSNALHRQTTEWLRPAPAGLEESETAPDVESESPYVQAQRNIEKVLDVWVRNFFVTTPMIGFLFYVFFRERRPAYLPHFVLGLELASVGVLAILIVRWIRLTWILVPPHIPLWEAWPPARHILFVGVLLITAGMAAAAIRRFYEVPMWKAVVASPLLFVAPVAVIAAISAAVMVLTLLVLT